MVSAHTIGPQTESTAAAPTTADAVEASDSVLLSRARLGDDGAFAALWRRNLPAAYAAATRFRGRVSPEDLVAEASARMLRLIREGNGPSENFRSYFVSTVRTVGVDAVRREMSIVPTDDVGPRPARRWPDKDLSALGAEGVDTDLVRAAFRQLSESDRQLLWHTMVEGDPPRVVAPLLGVSANVVSARAMRARDELRARYLDVWVQRRVPVCGAPECRWTLDHLSGHVRGRLTARQRERAEAHLAHCTRDARLAVELRRVYDGFGALTGPHRARGRRGDGRHPAARDHGRSHRLDGRGHRRCRWHDRGRHRRRHDRRGDRCRHDCCRDGCGWCDRGAAPPPARLPEARRQVPPAWAPR